MAKFCNKCGAPLIPGQPHICPAEQSASETSGTPNRAGAPSGGNGFGSQAGAPSGGNCFGGQAGAPNTGNGFGGQGGAPNGGNSFGGQGGAPNTGNGFGGQGGAPNGGNGFGGQAGAPNGGNGFGGQGGAPNTGNGFGGQGGAPNGGNGFGGQSGAPNGGNSFGGQAGGPNGAGYFGGQGGAGQGPAFQAASFRQWWTALMNRMGIGDPESNSDGVYERGMQIVPDNLALNEGEVPVRQYDVAVLRSRLKFQRAEGRLQVTNKRLLFRATGRSVRGKTTLQHEFALDDLKGFEIHKDYRFSFLDLLAALLCVAIVGGLFGGIVTGLLRTNVVFACLLGLVMGLAGAAPFFLLFRQFFLKMLCGAAGTGAAVSAFAAARVMAQYRDAFGWSLLSGLCTIVMVISVVVLILGIFLFCMKPNLIFDFKTMGGGAPIQIRRKRSLFFNFSSDRNEYTGFNEVLPAADTERALREVGALINDIQKMGDRAIEQWKSRS